MASFFHVNCPEGVSSKYRLIVFDDSKEAFIPLTEFYHDQDIDSIDSCVVSQAVTINIMNWLRSLEGASGVWYRRLRKCRVVSGYTGGHKENPTGQRFFTIMRNRRTRRKHRSEKSPRAASSTNRL